MAVTFSVSAAVNVALPDASLRIVPSPPFPLKLLFVPDAVKSGDWPLMKALLLLSSLFYILTQVLTECFCQVFSVKQKV